MNNNYNQNQVPGNVYNNEPIHPQNNINYSQYQNQQPINNQYNQHHQPIKPNKNNSTTVIIIIIVVAIVSIISIVGLMIIGSAFFVSNKTISSISSTLEQTEELEQPDTLLNGKFTIAGKELTLNNDYSILEKSGWQIDFSKLEEEDQTLESGYKTFSILKLENPKYPDSNVTVGLKNDSNTKMPLSKCKYWALTVDNTYSDTPVDFSLENGIKNGSSLQEVESVYGIPEEELDIYRSDSLKYTEYNYNYEYNIYLKLTIYDDRGLTGFSYKIY